MSCCLVPLLGLQQALLNVSVSDCPNVNELWSLYNTLQSHIRSLETLSITGSQYGVILTPIIVSRLPDSLRLEWAREGEQWESRQSAAGGDWRAVGVLGDGGDLGSCPGGALGATRSPQRSAAAGSSGLLPRQEAGAATYQGVEADLDFLMDFLHREIQRRERSQTFVTSDSSVATAAVLHTRSKKVKTKPVPCAFCGAKHATTDCSSKEDLTPDERKQKLYQDIVKK